MLFLSLNLSTVYMCMCVFCTVTEMLVNVLSLKDDDLADEGDEKIKPGSGIRISHLIYHVYHNTAWKYHM